MKAKTFRLPVFPNWFPFNDMLLDGHLKIGKYAGVKTRSWNWNYRGTVLLYNSGRTAYPAVDAYNYQDSVEKHKVIIGAGNLIKVRELTEDERLQMLCNFNNITLEQAEDGDYQISPFLIGFFFQNLRRFKNPIPFKWPAGPVKPIFTEIHSGSELNKQLKKSRNRPDNTEAKITEKQYVVNPEIALQTLEFGRAERRNGKTDAWLVAENGCHRPATKVEVKFLDEAEATLKSRWKSTS